MAAIRTLRCAIYTRKSSDEGLDQGFNSLDAQREACASYIASQKHEGWIALPSRYDDGGFSGGNMERPGIRQLMQDIRAMRVDVIVVYKVDRLTRSLADFAKIVELLDAQCISFVAVTQQFNTTTSMGRLTLNVLLSFAQFEREIAGERIRDKIKASRQKGMWMGGGVPLGYEVRDRALVIADAEAAKVRMIFLRYLELRSVRTLAAELQQSAIHSHQRITQGGKTIGGRPLSAGNLYLILHNPVYIGLAVHKGTSYPGLHAPIIDRVTWDQVQELLAANHVAHRHRSRARFPSPLAGIVFDSAGERLSPTHTNKNGVRHRYYISRSLVRGRPRHDEAGKRWRIPAHELETVVLAALRSLLDDHGRLSAILGLAPLAPNQTASVLAAAGALSASLSLDHSADLRERLHALVRRVEIGETALTIEINLGPFRLALGLEPPGDEEVEIHTIVLPVRIMKRGVEQKLILGAASASSGARDEVLVKAVARAYAWVEDLKAGRVRDIIEIARRSGLHASYVRSHLPLAFLAPGVVVAMLEGLQPADLSLERLTSRIDLSMDWSSQRRQLGFQD